jgi:ABC-2 type transport system ATP-binding protein
MSDSAVVISDVCKTYGKQQVLSRVNLDVRQGEFIGLAGVNGAGKTTLLKCMLDFTTINSGVIRIFAHEHTRIRARERLAYLPERFMPPYYLSGQDFLDYMMRLYRASPAAAEINRILAVLDLDPAALQKPVRQFSKGMSQKLGLAACLLSKREMLMLDEPMSGLDPLARAYLKQYLLELKMQGTTLFFSTHQLSDVELLCDRTAILHEGQIRFTGAPAACCQYYGTDDFEQAYLRCVNADVAIETD